MTSKSSKRNKSVSIECNNIVQNEFENLLNDSEESIRSYNNLIETTNSLIYDSAHVVSSSPEIPERLEYLNPSNNLKSEFSYSSETLADNDNDNSSNEDCNITENFIPCSAHFSYQLNHDEINESIIIKNNNRYDDIFSINSEEQSDIDSHCIEIDDDDDDEKMITTSQNHHHPGYSSDVLMDDSVKMNIEKELDILLNPTSSYLRMQSNLLAPREQASNHKENDDGKFYSNNNNNHDDNININNNTIGDNYKSTKVYSDCDKYLLKKSDFNPTDTKFLTKYEMMKRRKQAKSKKNEQPTPIPLADKSTNQNNSQPDAKQIDDLVSFIEGKKGNSLSRNSKQKTTISSVMTLTKEAKQQTSMTTTQTSSILPMKNIDKEKIRHRKKQHRNKNASRRQPSECSTGSASVETESTTSTNYSFEGTDRDANQSTSLSSQNYHTFATSSHQNCDIFDITLTGEAGDAEKCGGGLKNHKMISSNVMFPDNTPLKDDYNDDCHHLAKDRKNDENYFDNDVDEDDDNDNELKLNSDYSAEEEKGKDGDDEDDGDGDDGGRDDEDDDDVCGVGSSLDCITSNILNYNERDLSDNSNQNTVSPDTESVGHSPRQPLASVTTSTITMTTSITTMRTNPSSMAQSPTATSMLTIRQMATNNASIDSKVKVTLPSVTCYDAIDNFSDDNNDLDKNEILNHSKKHLCGPKHDDKNLAYVKKERYTSTTINSNPNNININSDVYFLQNNSNNNRHNTYYHKHINNDHNTTASAVASIGLLHLNKNSRNFKVNIIGGGVASADDDKTTECLFSTNPSSSVASCDEISSRDSEADEFVVVGKKKKLKFELQQQQPHQPQQQQHQQQPHRRQQSKEQKQQYIQYKNRQNNFNKSKTPFSEISSLKCSTSTVMVTSAATTTTATTIQSTCKSQEVQNLQKCNDLKKQQPENVSSHDENSKYIPKHNDITKDNDNNSNLNDSQITTSKNSDNIKNAKKNLTNTTVNVNFRIDSSKNPDRDKVFFDTRTLKQTSNPNDIVAVDTELSFVFNGLDLNDVACGDNSTKDSKDKLMIVNKTESSQCITSNETKSNAPLNNAEDKEINDDDGGNEDNTGASTNTVKEGECEAEEDLNDTKVHPQQEPIVEEKNQSSQCSLDQDSTTNFHNGYSVVADDQHYMGGKKQDAIDSGCIILNNNKIPQFLFDPHHHNNHHHHHPTYLPPYYATIINSDGHCVSCVDCKSDASSHSGTYVQHTPLTPHMITPYGCYMLPPMQQPTEQQQQRYQEQPSNEQLQQPYSLQPLDFSYQSMGGEIVFVPRYATAPYFRQINPEFDSGMYSGGTPQALGVEEVVLCGNGGIIGDDVINGGSVVFGNIMDSGVICNGEINGCGGGDSEGGFIICSATNDGNVNDDDTLEVKDDMGDDDYGYDDEGEGEDYDDGVFDGGHYPTDNMNSTIVCSDYCDNIPTMVGNDNNINFLNFDKKTHNLIHNKHSLLAEKCTRDYSFRNEVSASDGINNDGTKFTKDTDDNDIINRITNDIGNLYKRQISISHSNDTFDNGITDSGDVDYDNVGDGSETKEFTINYESVGYDGGNHGDDDSANNRNGEIVEGEEPKIDYSAQDHHHHQYHPQDYHQHHRPHNYHHHQQQHLQLIESNTSGMKLAVENNSIQSSFNNSCSKRQPNDIDGHEKCYYKTSHYKSHHHHHCNHHLFHHYNNTPNGNDYDEDDGGYDNDHHHCHSYGKTSMSMSNGKLFNLNKAQTYLQYMFKMSMNKDDLLVYSCGP